MQIYQRRNKYWFVFTIFIGLFVWVGERERESEIITEIRRKKQPEIWQMERKYSSKMRAKKLIKKHSYI